MEAPLYIHITEYSVADTVGTLISGNATLTTVATEHRDQAEPSERLEPAESEFQVETSTYKTCVQGNRSLLLFTAGVLSTSYTQTSPQTIGVLTPCTKKIPSPHVQIPLECTLFAISDL